MTDNDPRELLATARGAIGQLRAAQDPDEEYEAATALADAFAQLDQQLQAGGLLPPDWHPPMRHDAEGRWVERARAAHRLRLVLDRAIRDDEQADTTLAPADPKFRERLVNLLAEAVMQELELEQEQVKAMLATMARSQADRIAAAVAEAEARPMRVNVDPERAGREADRLLRIQGPTGALPPHLRRPSKS